MLITEVVDDRSVNENGLHSYGTINKSAVATGADLVAYSGFSATNYLEQPYNSALDYGTGDMYLCWYMQILPIVSVVTLIYLNVVLLVIAVNVELFTK